MSLRDDWKKTGAGLGHAFKDLGKSIVKSATNVVNKADEWANSEDKNEKEAEIKTEETKEEKEEK